MSWKSYAAVSGATVLAGWLASTPPANTPAGNTNAQVRGVASLSPAASDIERQADRLQSRALRDAVYAQPSRNLFRFGVRLSDRSAAISAETAAPREVIAPVRAGPIVRLSGIAEDQVDGHVERTAVLSSPAGVVLVRTGDDVLGAYRVASIESEAVELVTIADGTSVRLSLGRSN